MKKLLKLGIAMFAFLTVIFVLSSKPEVQAATEPTGMIEIHKMSYGLAPHVGENETPIDPDSRAPFSVTNQDYKKPLPDVEFTITQTHGLDANGNMVRLGNPISHEPQTTNVSGITTFYNLSLGRYEVRETDTVPGYILDPKTYHVDLTSDGQIVKLFPKNETIMAEKTVKVDATGEAFTGDVVEAFIGETITYRIAVTLPIDLHEEVTLADGTNVPQYKSIYIRDTLPDKLEVKNTRVEIEYANPDLGLYHPLFENTQGNTYELTLDSEILKQLKPGADIIIEITALITPAVLDGEQLINTLGEGDIIFTINNNEGEPEEYEPQTPPEVIVDVLGGSVTVVKKDSDTEAIIEEPAVFKLVHTVTGVEYHPTTDTDNPGYYTWKDLPLGVYNLVEVSAPEGYNELLKPIPVTITRTVYVLGEMTVYNVKKGTLPITGGMGTLAFTVIGLGLMGGAAYVLKKNGNKEEATNELNQEQDVD